MVRAPWSHAILGLVWTVTLAGVAFGACSGEGPEAVLDCFSRAYSERDAAMLDEVLAPDYIWLAVAPPEVDVFTREDSFASSVNMFHNPELELVSLEFRDGYSIEPGAEPDTWRIEGLLATLMVKRVSSEEPTSALLCVTLYVRATAGDSPGYEVYREVFFEGDGCVGK